MNMYQNNRKSVEVTVVEKFKQKQECLFLGDAYSKNATQESPVSQFQMTPLYMVEKFQEIRNESLFSQKKIAG